MGNLVNRDTLLGNGIPYNTIKVDDARQLDVCQICGKKIKCCTLGTYPQYWCTDCYDNKNERKTICKEKIADKRGIL